MYADSFSLNINGQVLLRHSARPAISLLVFPNIPKSSDNGCNKCQWGLDSLSVTQL